MEGVSGLNMLSKQEHIGVAATNQETQFISNILISVRQARTSQKEDNLKFQLYLFNFRHFRIDELINGLIFISTPYKYVLFFLESTDNNGHVVKLNQFIYHSSFLS